MIYKEGKSATAIYYGGKAAIAVYRGARMVWQAIRSCFGAGYWRGDKQWSRTDGWRRK